jgi:hypothetical protein
VRHPIPRRGAVVARRAHNPKVSGSNPLAATNSVGIPSYEKSYEGVFLCKKQTQVESV